MMPVFIRTCELPHAAETVFEWHTRPGALERLVPPWEDVRVEAREGGLHDGGRVRLSVRRGPKRFDWELRHTAFEEGRLFRDEQLRGPFTAWVHSHRFVPLEEGRCRIEDQIEWDVPGGGVAEKRVTGMLERLFDFRHRRLRNDLDLHSRFRGHPPLRVAISGSSGFIGGDLSHFLTAGGHEVVSLVRSRAAADRAGDKGVYWSVERGEIDASGLEGVDAVVHLAGEPIVALRWTREKKRSIRESRVAGTRLLSGALADLDAPPRTLVSASGVHYYGDRGNEPLSEESAPGEGFLAEVCRAWENAADPARRAGVRVVHLRSGLVLSARGGALGTMLLPFRLGVGGRLGSGSQYVPWIDLDDEVGLIHHALMAEGVRGPLNGSAPNPVPNAAFTSALGRVLDRPTLLLLPGIAIRALMGEMGETLLLQGQRAFPRKAEATGYGFLFEEIEESLGHQLGRHSTME
jgi:uncharacterized protein